MKKVTHVLGAFDSDGDLIHIVGFEEEPTEEMIESIKKELATDPEFGLTEIADTLTYRMGDQDLVDYANEIVQLNPPSETDLGPFSPN